VLAAITSIAISKVHVALEIKGCLRSYQILPKATDRRRAAVPITDSLTASG